MAIKSIQTGTLSIKDVESISTKIFPVDMSKSTLTWDGTATDAEYNGYYHVYIEFDDASTLTAYRRQFSVQEFVHWEIIENE